RFMGLRALYNGVIHFDKVRVPTQNIILGEGRGLKVALSTLNTGRLTLPAACSGMNQECLKIIRAWTKARVQWGTSIGNHDAIAQKVATIAADSLATEAMVAYTSSLVDRNKKADIRIEAAMAKMWGTERAWDIVNETMQIRGGRGYETAQSLQAREEAPVPVERFLRDCRINTIFEGSSEIMRLFIAREALDPHLRRGGPVLNSQLPWKDRLEALWKSALFYSHWYPSLWIPNPLPVQGVLHHPDKLRIHLRVVRGLSRRLARGLFHAMMIHGPTLEKKQALLGRFVDAGSELFAMTVVLGYAKSDQEQRIAEFFCQKSALRVRELLRRTRSHTDRTGKVLAKEILS
ncbi:MAG: acyl-CoA dehydrogenase family protein, partial [Verrucomicrobiota bacterium]